ncbi:MAG TPA: hypothetical protein VF541_20210 [Longimicrobium sp.]
MKIQRAAVPLAMALAACQSTQPAVRTATQPTTTRVETGNVGSVLLYEFRVAPESRVFTNLVPAPVARVWPVLPALYQEYGLAVTRLDEGRRVIGSQEHIARGRKIMGARPSELVECGRTPAGVPAADSYDLTLAVYTALEPDGEQSTKIETLVEGRARDPVSNNPPVTCTSTGKLERALAVAAVLRTQG